jgi:hypothetical protein
MDVDVDIDIDKGGKRWEEGWWAHKPKISEETQQTKLPVYHI